MYNIHVDYILGDECNCIIKENKMTEISTNFDEVP